MAKRRGSRFARKPLGFEGRGMDQVSATTFVTLPSGATIDKSGMSATAFTGELTGGATGTLHGSVDFGNSQHLKYYRGTAGVTGIPSGGGTTLSAGTKCITTGLTTVNDFVFSFNVGSGGTLYQSVASGRWPTHATFQIGYVDSGGVTLFLYGSNGACTPTIASGQWSGISISWLAIGS